MKKKILIIIALLMITDLYAEDLQLEKIAEFKNSFKDENSICTSYNIEPNEVTGNTMIISSKGQILIHCRDKNVVFEFDEANKKLKRVFKTNFLVDATYGHFSQITDNHYVFFAHNGSFYIVDSNFNLTARIEMLDKWDIRTHLREAYYDEEADIIFYIGYGFNPSMGCIAHPSLDDEKNRNNYKNAGKTMEDLEEGKYAPHLTLDEDNDLYIDGIRNKWSNTIYETKKYIVSIDNSIKRINAFDRHESEYFYYTIPEKEEVESIAFHPNGDYYLLSLNWDTKMFTIWRIENTWDPEWRKNWYKEHEKAVIAKKMEKDSVNKIMTCNDNLRLRNEEETDSKVITTMQKGT